MGSTTTSTASKTRGLYLLSHAWLRLFDQPLRSPTRQNRLTPTNPHSTLISLRCRMTTLTTTTALRRKGMATMLKDPTTFPYPTVVFKKWLTLSVATLDTLQM